MLIPVFSIGLFEAGAGDPSRQSLIGYLNIWDHMDEFARGIVDTRRLVYYLSGTALFLLLASHGARGEEGDAVSARSSRLGTSGAGILLAIAVFVGVNYLSLRHWKRFDWTHTQIYSLSETTKKILAGLKQPVQVTVFMTQGSSRAVARGQGAARALPGRQPEDRGRVPRPAAQHGPRGGPRQGSAA